MITFDIGGVDVRVKIESEPYGDPRAGWPESKRVGIITVDGKEVFRTEEQIAGGCSRQRWKYNRELLQACFDWVLINAVH